MNYLKIAEWAHKAETDARLISQMYGVLGAVKGLSPQAIEAIKGDIETLKRSQAASEKLIRKYAGV